MQPPLQMMFGQWPKSHRIFKGLCTGWSESLMVPHTTLLEISCHSSFVLGVQKKCLPKEVLLSTHNICFVLEIAHPYLKVYKSIHCHKKPCSMFLSAEFWP